MGWPTADTDDGATMMVVEAAAMVAAAIGVDGGTGMVDEVEFWATFSLSCFTRMVCTPPAIYTHVCAYKLRF
jgi:hypothetical protein